MKLIIEVDSVDPSDEQNLPIMGDRVVVSADNRVMVCGTVDGWKRNGQTSKPLKCDIIATRRD